MDTPTYNLQRRFIKARRADLYGINPGRARRIRGAFIHATRGGRSAGDDGPGTEAWMNHPSNKGAAYDALVYESGQQVKATYWEHNEEPHWCAGYGGAGTWSAQDYYVHFEVAQGTIDDPYTPEQVESVAQWVGELCRETGNWPIQRIDYLYQVGTAPYGVACHEDSANGDKLGKSDPGYQFPWDTFLERARYWAGQSAGAQEEDDLSAADIARIDRLERVMGGNGIAVLTTESNLEVVRKVCNTPDIPLGIVVAMTGEVAMSYLSDMGMSLFGGLTLTQAGLAALAQVVAGLAPGGDGVVSDEEFAELLERVAAKLRQSEDMGFSGPTETATPPEDV